MHKAAEPLIRSHPSQQSAASPWIRFLSLPLSQAFSLRQVKYPAFSMISLAERRMLQTAREAWLLKFPIYARAWRNYRPFSKERRLLQDREEQLSR